MERFEAFFEHGRAVAGEDVTTAVAEFLKRAKAGDRIEPRLLAGELPDELDADVDVVADLLNRATETDVRLLDDRTQVRCPFADCNARIDRRPLLDAVAESGEAECPDCHRVIKDPEGLRQLPRYGLSEEAALEAAAWQIEHGDDGRPRMRAVILCAIVDELAQVRRQLERAGVEVEEEPHEDGSVYLKAPFTGTFVDWEVTAAFTKQTNYEAGSSTVGAIMTFAPQIIIYLGIAGSLKDEVHLGDVVVADVVHDYEVGKEKAASGDTDAHYEPRPLQHLPAYQLQQWAGVIKTTPTWRDRILVHDEVLAGEPDVHIEPIAAGSKVVATEDSHTFRLIGDVAPRAVAVEMEGAGFLAAAHRFKDTTGLLVRGISDLLDEKELSDKTGWRHQAAANAAAFAFELLARYKPVPTQNPSESA